MRNEGNSMSYTHLNLNESMKNRNPSGVGMEFGLRVGTYMGTLRESDSRYGFRQELTIRRVWRPMRN